MRFVKVVKLPSDSSVAYVARSVAYNAKMLVMQETEIIHGRGAGEAPDRNGISYERKDAGFIKKKFITNWKNFTIE